jgi:hypothetical protein
MDRYRLGVEHRLVLPSRLCQVRYEVHCHQVSPSQEGQEDRRRSPRGCRWCPNQANHLPSRVSLREFRTLRKYLSPDSLPLTVLFYYSPTEPTSSLVLWAVSVSRLAPRSRCPRRSSPGSRQSRPSSLVPLCRGLLPEYRLLREARSTGGKEEYLRSGKAIDPSVLRYIHSPLSIPFLSLHPFPPFLNTPNSFISLPT